MSDINDRLEAATAPSGALDAEIALATGWEIKWVGSQDWWRRPDGPWEMQPPAFTSSLDAAATLIPKDCVRRTSQIRFGLWRVELWRGVDTSFSAPPLVDLAHVTEPLALCIAALKARATLTGSPLPATPSQ